MCLQVTGHMRFCLHVVDERYLRGMLQGERYLRCMLQGERYLRGMLWGERYLSSSKLLCML